MHFIFALDYAVVEVQEMFSSHGGLLTNAIYQHGATIKLTYHDETKKRAHDSQIVRAKKTQVEPRWIQLQISIRHQPTD